MSGIPLNGSFRDRCLICYRCTPCFPRCRALPVRHFVSSQNTFFRRPEDVKTNETQEHQTDDNPEDGSFAAYSSQWHVLTPLLDPWVLEVTEQLRVWRQHQGGASAQDLLIRLQPPCEGIELR